MQRYSRELQVPRAAPEQSPPSVVGQPTSIEGDGLLEGEGEDDLVTVAVVDPEAVIELEAETVGVSLAEGETVAVTDVEEVTVAVSEPDIVTVGETEEDAVTVGDIEGVILTVGDEVTVTVCV